MQRIKLWMESYRAANLAPGARIALALVVGFSLVNFAYFGLWPVHNFPIDFAAFYCGARAGLAGEPSCYDEEILTRYERALPGVPPDYWMRQLQTPIGLTLIAPYALLPFTAARVLWWLTGVALVFVAAWYVGKVVDPEAKDWWRGLGVLLVFLNFQTIGVVLGLGQTPVIDLACFAGALWCWTRGRDLWCGALLALACVSKGNLFLVVVFLLLMRPRALAGYALAIVMGVLVSVAVFGPQIYPDYVTRFLALREYNTASQTVSGFVQALYRVVMREQLDQYFYKFPLWQFALWWSPNLVVIAVTVLAWRRARPELQPLGAFLCLVPATMLISFYIFPRHMLPLALCFAGALTEGFAETAPRRWLWLLALGFGIIALEYNWRPRYLGAMELLEYTKLAGLLAVWLFMVLWGREAGIAGERRESGIVREGSRELEAGG